MLIIKMAKILSANKLSFDFDFDLPFHFISATAFGLGYMDPALIFPNERLIPQCHISLYLKYANVPKSEIVLIKKKCEELYSVMNSVNDISPMSLTVFFVVLYCCACRRKFQFLPGCFFRPVVY